VLNHRRAVRLQRDVSNRQLPTKMEGMEQPSLSSRHDPLLPRVPRFSLRALLLALAIVSVLFAVMSSIGLLWSVVLIWTLLLVAGHVLGNLWGSQAYDYQGPRAHNLEPATQGTRARTPIHPDTIPLRQQVRGGRTRLVGSACGALLLGFAGGTFLTFFYWYQSTSAGIMVWYLSCGIVGALAGFVASGFLQVFTIRTPPSQLLAPLDSSQLPGQPTAPPIR
jgi:hypothetical protein